jgi:hypothetical protein
MILRDGSPRGPSPSIGFLPLPRYFWAPLRFPAGELRRDSEKLAQRPMLGARLLGESARQAGKDAVCGRTGCLNAKSSVERVVYKRLNSTGTQYSTESGSFVPSQM